MERAYLPSTTLGEDVYPLAGLHLLKNVQEGDVVDAAAALNGKSLLDRERESNKPCQQWRNWRWRSSCSSTPRCRCPSGRSSACWSELDVDQQRNSVLGLTRGQSKPGSSKVVWWLLTVMRPWLSGRSKYCCSFSLWYLRMKFPERNIHLCVIEDFQAQILHAAHGLECQVAEQVSKQISSAYWATRRGNISLSSGRAFFGLSLRRSGLSALAYSLFAYLGHELQPERESTIRSTWRQRTPSFLRQWLLSVSRMAFWLSWWSYSSVRTR